tara:strand:+ start:645 stop:1583 length:939 start_codon:yes stop_codon:yes gene_type:complete
MGRLFFMAKPSKYQDVYKLLDENPGMTPAEAGRQLGYKFELHWKSKEDRRVGPKSRGSDSNRSFRSKQQTIGGKNPIWNTSTPGFQKHHKRMISLYAPLYKNLKDSEAIELSKHALEQGLALGDHLDNYQPLPKSVHTKVHDYMRKHGMTGSHMPDFSGADLKTRIKAFDALYRDYIQPDIDRATKFFLTDFELEFKRAKDFPRGVNVLPENSRGLRRLAKNVTRAIPGPLDNFAVGVPLAVAAAGHASLTNGNPAQAAADTTVDFLTDDFSGGQLSPGTLESHEDELRRHKISNGMTSDMFPNPNGFNGTY